MLPSAALDPCSHVVLTEALSDRDRLRFKTINANLAHGDHVCTTTLVRLRNRLRSEEPPFLIRFKHICSCVFRSGRSVQNIPQRNTNGIRRCAQAGNLQRSTHGRLPRYWLTLSRHRRHLGQLLEESSIRPNDFLTRGRQEWPVVGTRETLMRRQYVYVWS